MANISLTFSQKKRLQDEIQRDFNRTQFMDFVWMKLKVLPASISREAYPDYIAKVIEWAEDRSRTGELLRELASTIPTSATIHTIWKEFQGEVIQALGHVYPSSDSGEFESIVLKSVPFENLGEWLDRMELIRHAVCRIEPQPETKSKSSLEGYATGFLVGPGIVLTCYHVAKKFRSKEVSLQTRIRFDYEFGTDDPKDRSRTYSLADQWLLADSPVDQLDYAFLRLAETPGNDSNMAELQRHIRVADHRFEKDEPLLIVEHPLAEPLKLALGVVVAPTEGSRVTYTVNTDAGSSGSPCLTSSLEAVALHHWGGANHNRGVRLGPIIKHLEETRTFGLLDLQNGV